MYYVGNIPCTPYDLKHFGIKGMAWGKRRFQNEDGSLTAAGKNRYDIGSAIGGAVRSAGDAVGRAARSAGDAARSAGSTISGAVNSGVRSADKMLGISASQRLESARTERASIQKRLDTNYRDENSRDNQRFNKDYERHNQQVEVNKHLSEKAQSHESAAKEAHNAASMSVKQALSTGNISAGEKAANNFLSAVKSENYHNEAAKAYRLLMLQNQPQQVEAWTEREEQTFHRLNNRDEELRSEIVQLEKEVDSSVLGRVKKTFGKGRDFVSGLFGR